MTSRMTFGLWVVLILYSVCHVVAEECQEGEEDKVSACYIYKARGYCAEGHIYSSYMKRNCYAACGYCTPAPTPIPAVDSSDCLGAHNDKRALHQDTSALEWDDDLAQKAKEWADHLVKEGSMVHSTSEQRNGAGENLYWSRSFVASTCVDAVKAWYENEIGNYNFDNPPTSISGGIGGGQIGHFTQVVWKSTTKVGVGLASYRDSSGYMVTYVVARYSPAGNYRGQFAQEVGDLKCKGKQYKRLKKAGATSPAGSADIPDASPIYQSSGWISWISKTVDIIM